MKARAVNVRREDCDIYVGRPSRWGNPFPVAVHGRAAMRLYMDHLAEHPEEVEDARRLLPGLRLGCYGCKPVCHAEVLARLANREELQAIREDVIERLAETRSLFG